MLIIAGFFRYIQSGMGRNGMLYNFHLAIQTDRKSHGIEKTKRQHSDVTHLSICL